MFRFSPPVLQLIVSACESSDEQAFSAAVAEYDSISKFDAWKTKILLRVLNAIRHPDQAVAV